jgi:hypothetical protein
MLPVLPSRWMLVLQGLLGRRSTPISPDLVGRRVDLRLDEVSDGVPRRLNGRVRAVHPAVRTASRRMGRTGTSVEAISITLEPPLDLAGTRHMEVVAMPRMVGYGFWTAGFHHVPVDVHPSFGREGEELAWDDVLANGFLRFAR